MGLFRGRCEKSRESGTCREEVLKWKHHGQQEDKNLLGY